MQRPALAARGPADSLYVFTLDLNSFGVFDPSEEFARRIQLDVTVGGSA